MNITPYQSNVSPYLAERLGEGATIVDILTDFRTPCYVYQAADNDDNGGFPNKIATNVGATLSGHNLESFIFENYHGENRFQLRYLGGNRTIVQLPFIAIPTNPGKQLGNIWFSEIIYHGTYEDILREFEENGFDIERWKNHRSPEEAGRWAKLLREIDQIVDPLQEEFIQKAREFYKEQERALSEKG